MLKRQYDCFIGCDKEYEEAKTVLFGAPFDSTTSYRPGARFAPKVIRAESFGIETYSPYQDRDITDIAVMDSGDIELPFGNTERVLGMIEERVRRILTDGKKPVMMGGEHLVTLGAVKAAAKIFPDLHILHFDAHCDLREYYLGEKLSHATVMRSIWDILGDGRIYQLGIRSGDKEEFVFAHKHTVMYKYNLNRLDEVIEKLKDKPVYFSLDLDVLDTAMFPGTGTPEPGGIGFLELLEGVIKLKGLNIIGCDMNELCPSYDMSGASTAVACKTLRELLLSVTD
jgi:agmatinase